MTPNIPLDAAGIALRGVTKSYGRVVARRGVDLVVAPGETVALLGPNGAGKSTTLDIVLGLGHADAGTVSVFGRTRPRPSTTAWWAACCRPARSCATSRCPSWWP